MPTNAPDRHATTNRLVTIVRLAAVACQIPANAEHATAATDVVRPVATLVGLAQVNVDIGPATARFASAAGAATSRAGAASGHGAVGAHRPGDCTRRMALQD